MLFQQPAMLCMVGKQVFTSAVCQRFASALVPGARKVLGNAPANMEVTSYFALWQRSHKESRALN